MTDDMNQLDMVFDRVNPQDRERAAKLTGDLKKVFQLISNGESWSVTLIAQTLHLPETSVSAQLRNLRKKQHGGWNVKRISVTKGFSLYRLVK